ncbi:redox-sensing transcriptional repressor Rex [Actinomycetota bacterium]
MVSRAIPTATVARLPVYLRSLVDLPASQETCSSDQLAAIAGVNSAQVRKDLSHFGSLGTRGVGYNVGELRSLLREALGLTREYSVVLIGAGNLGSALANYSGFDAWGFEIVAVFDTEADKIGQPAGDLVIQHLDDLEKVVADRAVSIAIIATPAGAAQEVADRIMRSGVRSILNFAPSVLQVSDEVWVRRVDLSTELQILTFHLSALADESAAG